MEVEKRFRREHPRKGDGSERRFLRRNGRRGGEGRGEEKEGSKTEEDASDETEEMKNAPTKRAPELSMKKASAVNERILRCASAEALERFG